MGLSDNYLMENNNYFYYEINTKNTELLKQVTDAVENWGAVENSGSDERFEFPIKALEIIPGEHFTIIKGAYYEHSDEFNEILEDETFVAINEAVNKANDGSSGYCLLIDHDKDQFVFCGGLQKLAATAEECKDTVWFKLSDTVYSMFAEKDMPKELIAGCLSDAINRETSILEGYVYEPESRANYWAHSSLSPQEGEFVEVYTYDSETILSALDEYSDAAKKLKTSGIMLCLVDDWDLEYHPDYQNVDELYLGFVSKDGKSFMIVTTDTDGNYSVEYSKISRN